MRNIIVLALSVAGLFVAAGPMRAAAQYPLSLTLDAQMKTGDTTVNSKITIQIDRAMENVRRTRVTDALKFGGYQNFLNALRAVPAVGSIRTQSTKVDVRYTREDEAGANTRLVLIADQPLSFLSSNPTKQKVGFELTLMDLTIEPNGAVTGKLAAAGRVRPSPDGGVLLDTYADQLIDLKGQVAK
jgi:hypothetical protein